MTKRRSDDELFVRLGEHLDAGVLTPAVTPNEVDAELRARAGNPAAIAERGAALAERLLDARRLAWQDEASQKMMRLRTAVAEAEPVGDDATIEELEAELAALRGERSLGGQLEAYFSKRTSGNVTVEELRVLVHGARRTIALARAKKRGDI